LNFIKINYSWSGISADALGELRLLDHLDKLELRYANRQITTEYGMAISKISSLRGADHQQQRHRSEGDRLPQRPAEAHHARPAFCREFSDANAVALTQLRQLESLDLSYNRHHSRRARCPVNAAAPAATDHHRHKHHRERCASVQAGGEGRGERGEGEVVENPTAS